MYSHGSFQCQLTHISSTQYSYMHRNNMHFLLIQLSNIRYANIHSLMLRNCTYSIYDTRCKQTVLLQISQLTFTTQNLKEHDIIRTIINPASLQATHSVSNALRERTVQIQILPEKPSIYNKMYTPPLLESKLERSCDKGWPYWYRYNSACHVFTMSRIHFLKVAI